MHWKDALAILLSGGVTAIGLTVALVGSGTALFVEDWPDGGLGIAGLPLGLALTLGGLLLAPLTLFIARKDATAYDGAVAGLLATVLPAVCVLQTWIAIARTADVRAAATSGAGTPETMVRHLASGIVECLVVAPAGSLGLTLFGGVVGGLTLAALRRPWMRERRPVRLSWFPVWVAYQLVGLIGVHSGALAALGPNVQQAVPEAGLQAFLISELSPLVLLACLATTLAISGFQLGTAWRGGDRLGAMVVGGALLLLGLVGGAVDFVAFGGTAAWAGLVTTTSLLSLAAGVASTRFLEPRPLSRGTLPFRQLPGRALSQALLGGGLFLGPGGIVAGLDVALLLVRPIPQLAGSEESFDPLPDIEVLWQFVGLLPLFALALFVLAFLGMAVRHVIRRAVLGPPQVTDLPALPSKLEPAGTEPTADAASALRVPMPTPEPAPGRPVTTPDPWKPPE